MKNGSTAVGMSLSSRAAARQPGAQYQPPLMLTHEEWVNRGRYESLFARRRPPTPRAIPTARRAVRVGLSGGWYQTGDFSTRRQIASHEEQGCDIRPSSRDITPGALRSTVRSFVRLGP